MSAMAIYRKSRISATVSWRTNRVSVPGTAERLTLGLQEFDSTTPRVTMSSTFTSDVIDVIDVAGFLRSQRGRPITKMFMLSGNFLVTENTPSLSVRPFTISFLDNVIPTSRPRTGLPLFPSRTKTRSVTASLATCPCTEPASEERMESKTARSRSFVTGATLICMMGNTNFAIGFR
jgi:hypothetical protein